ncbi:MAG: SDR family oxidoreductase [Solobacterium sp.]|nr:SDR family oxidoreductase [Solobacterium sp.]MBR3127376.1 SDR family oxidoreductase [Solobacterium sp.]
MEQKLKDKVVVITGTTSGIGAGMAKLFAAHGAKVVGSGRRQEKGEAVVKEIIDNGGEATFVRTDVLDQEQLQNLIDTAVNKYGRIDILVNNAAYEPTKVFAENTYDDYRKVIDTNLGSYIMASIYALKYMREQKSGKILNINSVTAEQVVPGVGMYAIAKAGITNLTKIIALEYAKEGIRCNEVNPGLIMAGAFEDPAVREWAHDAIVNGTPVGRLGTVEEIANAALYLLSDEADFVNGTSFYIDGGRRLI